MPAPWYKKVGLCSLVGFQCVYKSYPIIYVWLHKHSSVGVSSSSYYVYDALPWKHIHILFLTGQDGRASAISWRHSAAKGQKTQGDSMCGDLVTLFPCHDSMCLCIGMYGVFR